MKIYKKKQLTKREIIEGKNKNVKSIEISGEKKER